MVRLMSPLYLCVSFILTIAITTQGQFNHRHGITTRREFTACSNELSSLVSEVCNGTFNAPHVKRGSYQGWEVFIPKHKAKRILRSSYRLQSESGLANECCLKECTLQEVIEYCAQPVSNDIVEKIQTTWARPRHTTISPNTLPLTYVQDGAAVVITSTTPSTKSPEVIYHDISNLSMNDEKKSILDEDHEILAQFFRMLRAARLHREK